MKSLFLIVSLLLSSKVLYAGEIKITPELSKEKVMVGEVFEYRINIEGSFRITPQVSIPELKNFKIISRQQVYNYHIEKGKIKANLRYKFSLVALREGDFEIKNFKLKLGLKEYKVTPLKVKVKGIKELPRKKENPQKQKINQEEGLWI